MIVWELAPQQPHYKGKVVILANELTFGNSEFSAMAFRAAPRAIVVGCETGAGAATLDRWAVLDLPGGLRVEMSGTGVFQADKRPTQRIGIVADVPAKRTLAGMRAGRDEILEAGLRQIIGAQKAAAVINTLRREK
jgi:C-terminal processing protease CtpA/Prc